MGAKFSVSMSVYHKDEPEHFRRAFLSVVNQTLTPSEVVLVVDGPIPKETSDIISCLKVNYSFLKVVEIKQNKGHGNARRVGLDVCTNDIIAVMDSDDISVINRFELQHEFLSKNPNISLVGGQIEEFVGNAENIVSKRCVPVEDEQIKQFMKSRCPFNQMTVMFRKSAVIEAGGYIDFYHNEDYYLWIRMFLKNCKFHNLESVLVKARIDDKFYNRRGGLKYFQSECKIQQILYKSKITSIYKFILNVCLRFILQVLIGSAIRGFIFKNIARKNI